MFRWLNGPGQSFKDPLPGSTNYLNAYNAAGGLIRTMGKHKSQDDPKEKLRGKDNEEDQDEVAQDGSKKERHKKPWSEKVLNELGAAKTKVAPGLPKEENVDLMPFPMNSQFRSHPVLSEELRDEIYKRIAEEKKSVRDVSAALGVEMRRVGAVVRLKAIEKQWEQEVCPISTSRFSSFPLHGTI